VTFTAATTYLALARYHVLPETELQDRFRVFRNICIDILRSTSSRSILVSQSESLLSFLQNMLSDNESNFESGSMQKNSMTTTNIAQGNQSTSASAAASQYYFAHDGTEPSLQPSTEYITPDSAILANDAWDSFDFVQMLDQQFLDPAWLEDIPVHE